MRYLMILIFFFAIKHISAQVNIPVLCYHNIYAGTGHKNDLMHISNEQLNLQLKSLADSGYRTILPDELLAYLTGKRPAPAKLLMITFDDSHVEHFSIADSLLRRYGFRGIFFVMTVTLGKPGYMTTEQIRKLADRGHIIGSHTWDHPHLYATGKMDWEKQLLRPRKTLEKITDKPVWYFAYPFGEWNDTIISHLERSGYRAAFQLNGHRGNALFTIRRMITDGRWSGVRLQSEMLRFSKEN